MNNASLSGGHPLTEQEDERAQLMEKRRTPVDDWDPYLKFLYGRAWEGARQSIFETILAAVFYLSAIVINFLLLKYDEARFVKPFLLFRAAPPTLVNMAMQGILLFCAKWS
jgi:hypothetical protein